MADEEYSKASADADREMTRLWRTWRTVFEMLADRVWQLLAFIFQDAMGRFLLKFVSLFFSSLQGYEVTEEEIKIPLNEFRKRYSDELGFPE